MPSAMLLPWTPGSASAVAGLIRVLGTVLPAMPCAGASEDDVTCGALSGLDWHVVACLFA